MTLELSGSGEWTLAAAFVPPATTVDPAFLGVGIGLVFAGLVALVFDHRTPGAVSAGEDDRG